MLAFLLLKQFFKLSKVRLLIVIFALVSNGGNAQEAKSSKEKWAENLSRICKRDIKSSTAKEDGMYVKYSRLAPVEVAAPYWVVRWEGFSVPVPDIEYSIMSFSNDRLILSSRIESFYLVFQIIKPLSFPNVQPLAKNFEAITLRNMTDIAYSITPDDVTCQVDKADSEALPIAALVTKGRLKKLISAHKVGGVNNVTWLLNSERTADLVDWEALRYDSSDTERSVSFVTLRKSKYSNIGTLVNSPKLNEDHARPAWVDALQTAIIRWDEKSARQLSKALDIEYFD